MVSLVEILVSPSSPFLWYNIVGVEEDEEDAEKADVIINIKELDDVLMKDVGNNIAASDK